jgi:GR25 family glycosyltransferase involved in LPS biosynthesis
MFSRVINLDRRKDRWSVMEKFMVKNPGLNLQRFPAIEPTIELAQTVLHSSLRESAVDGWPRYRPEEIKGLGAIGCFLSHRQVWKDFLSSSAPVALVLEDDLDAKDVDKLSECVYPYLKNQQWDFVLLGWVGTLGNPRKHFTGTHAYMLSRNMATRLLQHSHPINQQVDYYMNAILKQFPDLRMEISPHRLRQASSPSDILTWVWIDILAVVWGVLCILILLYYFLK